MANLPFQFRENIETWTYSVVLFRLFFLMAAGSFRFFMIFWIWVCPISLLAGTFLLLTSMKGSNLLKPKNWIKWTDFLLLFLFINKSEKNMVYKNKPGCLHIYLHEATIFNRQVRRKKTSYQRVYLFIDACKSFFNIRQVVVSLHAPISR